MDVNMVWKVLIYIISFFITLILFIISERSLDVFILSDLKSFGDTFSTFYPHFIVLHQILNKISCAPFKLKFKPCLVTNFRPIEMLLSCHICLKIKRTTYFFASFYLSNIWDIEKNLIEKIFIQKLRKLNIYGYY